MSTSSRIPISLLRLSASSKYSSSSTPHTRMFRTRQSQQQQQQQQQSPRQKITILGRRIPQHRWTSSKATTTTSSSSSSAVKEAVVAKEPPYRTLRWLAFTTGLPFVGFGFMDNAILIIAGDAIDTSLGVTLGISTMCAAAIGNIISDLAGIGAGAYIEDFCVRVLKLPVPKLDSTQRQLRSVRMASQTGMAIGMTIGCVLGMIPLFFIDSNKAEKLRKKARLEKLCQDVLNEAKTLVGAESTSLYLRVDKDEDRKITDNKGNNIKHQRGEDVGIHGYHPSVSGGYLYAMYYVEPHHQHNRSSPRKALMRMVSAGDVSNRIGSTRSDTNDTITGAFDESNSNSNSDDSVVQVTRPPPPLPVPSLSQSRAIPVGKGIVSRAVLTGTTWNIVGSLKDEPDFFPLSIETTDGCTNLDHGYFRDLVVVPILDGQGRVIAVLEALNKKTDDNGFSDDDVDVLSSLASHVSVSLQTIYQNSEDEDLRLRDTIRILKKGKGIQRSKTEGGSSYSIHNDDDDDDFDDDDDHDGGVGGKNSKYDVPQNTTATKSKRRLFPD
jgi:GAF domain-containing protein